MEDMPMENGEYTILKDGDKFVGGLMPMPEQANGNMPTWMSYITVDDVDARTKRAQTLGATLIMAPRDIPDVGRFAVIQDPTGAAVSLITYTC
jgi:predicted enzyme related to lactoylglutathione lyase